MAGKNTLCETAVMPDGRGDILSASSVNKLLNKDTSQSTLIRGIPFEGLENSAQSSLAREISGGEPGKLPGHIVISQEVETDYNFQNEARTSFGGGYLGNQFGIPHNEVRNVSGTAEMIENETVTAEVTNVNKSKRTAQEPGISLAYYQQQMMLQQQLMMQQQQTVNALIGKVDNLAKIVGQKELTSPEAENISRKQMKLKVNELPKQTDHKSRSESRTHEISESSDGESSEDENWGLDRIDSEDYNSDDSQTERSKSPPAHTKEQTTVSTSAAYKSQEKTHVSANMKLLKEMGQEFEKLEAVSSKVDETLATVVNSGVRAKIDRKVAKELCEKYQRPENCEALKVPKLNKELWTTGALGKFSKERDKMIQTAQRYLNHGLMPLVQLMEDLLKDENSEERFKLARDSFQMLAYAHRDISNVRRQILKSNVSEKYKQLCNDSTPITENLLGDDLEKQIKTLDEMRKVGKDISKGKGEKRKYKGNDNDRNRKYHKQNYGYRNRDRYDGSFLERRARYHKPGGVHNKGYNNKKNQKQ